MNGEQPSQPGLQETGDPELDKAFQKVLPLAEEHDRKVGGNKFGLVPKKAKEKPIEPPAVEEARVTESILSKASKMKVFGRNLTDLTDLSGRLVGSAVHSVLHPVDTAGSVAGSMWHHKEELLTGGVAAFAVKTATRAVLVGSGGIVVAAAAGALGGAASGGVKEYVRQWKAGELDIGETDKTKIIGALKNNFRRMQVADRRKIAIASAKGAAFGTIGALIGLEITEIIAHNEAIQGLFSGAGQWVHEQAENVAQRPQATYSGPPAPAMPEAPDVSTGTGAPVETPPAVSSAPTATAAPTATPVPTEAPKPTFTATFAPEATLTGTPVPAETSVPAATSTPTPTSLAALPTETPVPTATPTVTPTPVVDQPALVADGTQPPIDAGQPPVAPGTAPIAQPLSEPAAGLPPAATDEIQPVPQPAAPEPAPVAPQLQTEPAVPAEPPPAVETPPAAAESEIPEVPPQPEALDHVIAPNGAVVDGSAADGTLTYDGKPWALLDNGTKNIDHLFKTIGETGSIDHDVLGAKLQEATNLWAQGQLTPGDHEDLYKVFHLSNGTASVYNSLLDDDTLDSLKKLGIVK